MKHGTEFQALLAQELYQIDLRLKDAKDDLRRAKQCEDVPFQRVCERDLENIKEAKATIKQALRAYEKMMRL